MTGDWFSTPKAGLSGSVGRRVEPGRDPDAPAAGVLTLIAELFCGLDAVPVFEGPGLEMGVLVCVER